MKETQGFSRKVILLLVLMLITDLCFPAVLCSRGTPTVQTVPIGAKDNVIFQVIIGVRACFAKFAVSEKYFSPSQWFTFSNISR